MIWKLILGLLFPSVLVLCIRVLRRSKGTSLLAWHVLFFVIVFDLSAYFIENAALWQSNPVLFDEVVADRIILSLILVNLVAIAYLLFLARMTSHAYALHRVPISAFSQTPVFYWIAIPSVVLGFIIFFNSPMIRVVREYGLQSFGDFRDYYSVRFDAGVAGMSMLEWYVSFILMRTVLPLITLYSLQRFVLGGNKIWLVRWFLLVLLWGIIAILSFGKSFIVNLVLSNAIVVIMLLRFKGVRRKVFVSGLVVGVVVLLTLGFIYGVVEGREDLLEGVSELFERTFLIPMVTTYRHYLVFPELHLYTYYSDSRTLNFFLAGGHPKATTLTAYQIASFYTVGIAFNMNTSFLGDTWAALGYVGVVQGALLIFGVFLFWDIYFLRKKVFVPLIALVGYFLGGFYNIFNAPLMTMFLSSGMIFGPVFWLLLFHRKLQLGMPKHFRPLGSLRTPSSSDTFVPKKTEVLG